MNNNGIIHRSNKKLWKTKHLPDAVSTTANNIVALAISCILFKYLIRSYSIRLSNSTTIIEWTFSFILEINWYLEISSDDKVIAFRIFELFFHDSMSTKECCVTRALILVSANLGDVSYRWLICMIKKKLLTKTKSQHDFPWLFLCLLSRRGNFWFVILIH